MYTVYQCAYVYLSINVYRKQDICKRKTVKYQTQNNLVGISEQFRLISSPGCCVVYEHFREPTR